MRKKLLQFLIPVSAVIVGLTGMLNPREASAAGRVCNYYCLDPQLTCCITCYWVGGSCVSPEYCTIEPLDW